MAARWFTSDAPWSETWLWPEIWATCIAGDTLIDLRDIENHPPEDVVIISTGSQGEPLSALSRMANRDHPVITLRAGDTVVLASSLIPGNESAVYRVINGLSKLGLMSCTGETPWCTCPDTPAPSCSSATTSCDRATCCRPWRGQTSDRQR